MYTQFTIHAHTHAQHAFTMCTLAHTHTHMHMHTHTHTHTHAHTHTHTTGGVIWRSNITTLNTVQLPPVENLSPPPPQMPMAIPRDLADRLMAFHGYPFVWFIGQFLQYILRLSPALLKFVDSNRRDLGFQHPIVG